MVYNKINEIEYDLQKSERNVMERGLPFALAAKFDFDSAIIYEDKRKDYGETRYFSLGLIGDRLHALVFTATPTGIRVISLRKANLREVQGYEQSQT